MKKIIILFAMLFLAMAQTALANDVSKGIHVGNAGSFTGDAAAPCMEIFNSSQFAVDEWNARGGFRALKLNI